MKVKDFEPFILKPPITLEIIFANAGMADIAEMVPSSKRKDGRTVSFVADNYLEAYRTMRAMIILAGTLI